MDIDPNLDRKVVDTQRMIRAILASPYAKINNLSLDGVRKIAEKTVDLAYKSNLSQLTSGEVDYLAVIKGMFGRFLKDAPKGSVYAPLLTRAAAIPAAAVGGYGVGRVLGNTPLLTDPNMTYDQFYTDAFTKFLAKGKKE